MRLDLVIISSYAAIALVHLTFFILHAKYSSQPTKSDELSFILFMSAFWPLFIAIVLVLGLCACFMRGYSGLLKWINTKPDPTAKPQPEEY